MFKWKFRTLIVVILGFFTMPDLGIARNLGSELSSRKAIIFDLNGVLVETDMLKALWHLGYHVAPYWLLEGKGFKHLKDLLYTFLCNEEEALHGRLRDPYGDFLPGVFCDVFNGSTSETDCHKKAKVSLEVQKSRCSSAREYILCHRAIDMIFDPTLLARMQKTKLATLKILRACKRAGHEIFIVSNYGKESYEVLRSRLPEIFDELSPENIIISAHVEAVKPHTAIYDVVHERLKAKGINPSPLTTFFIDDQNENVQAAWEHDMHGILFTNAYQLEKQLKIYGIL